MKVVLNLGVAEIKERERDGEKSRKTYFRESGEESEREREKEGARERKRERETEKNERASDKQEEEDRAPAEEEVSRIAAEKQECHTEMWEI